MKLDRLVARAAYLVHILERGARRPQRRCTALHAGQCLAAASRAPCRRVARAGQLHRQPLYAPQQPQVPVRETPSEAMGMTGTWAAMVFSEAADRLPCSAHASVWALRALLPGVCQLCAASMATLRALRPSTRMEARVRRGMLPAQPTVHLQFGPAHDSMSMHHSSTTPFSLALWCRFQQAAVGQNHCYRVFGSCCLFKE